MVTTWYKIKNQAVTISANFVKASGPSNVKRTLITIDHNDNGNGPPDLAGLLKFGGYFGDQPVMISWGGRGGGRPILVAGHSSPPLP